MVQAAPPPDGDDGYFHSKQPGQSPVASAKEEIKRLKDVNKEHERKLATVRTEQLTVELFGRRLVATRVVGAAAEPAEGGTSPPHAAASTGAATTGPPLTAPSGGAAITVGQAAAGLALLVLAGAALLNRRSPHVARRISRRRQDPTT